MPIEYIEGDLFNTHVKYIMHGCNAQGVMGSGVAKIIKEKFPKAYSEYYQRHRDYGLKPGEVQVVDCGSNIILNAITQDRYGRRDDTRYASYDAIDDVMKWIESNVDVAGFAMPMIGAGLGNGNWAVIEKIIESRLVNTRAYIYVI